MTVQLRNLRLEEFSRLMRMLERSFGHSYDFFRREYPHLYRPTAEACRWAYVVEEDGALVAHVGLYPLEIVNQGISIRVGGIGGVASVPEVRGKGYMSRLLRHVVDEMRAQNHVLSWLSGDRQRYNTFGWEMAGLAYRLTFSNRSLTWGGSPLTILDLEPVLPWAAASTIAGFVDESCCHTIRPTLDLLLRKQGVRAWVGEDGYALAQAEGRHNLHLLELVSTEAQERRWLHTLLQMTGAEQVIWQMGGGDTVRLARLQPWAVGWGMTGDDMYRVNDLVGLLRRYRPLLEQRAAGLADFCVVVAMTEYDRTTAVTLRVRGGSVGIEPVDAEAADITLSAPQVTRLLLGGPPIPQADALPANLRALLPLPVYVPPLDHV
jgi:predicted N-acetyltransferase YhbS